MKLEGGQGPHMALSEHTRQVFGILLRGGNTTTRQV